MMGRGLWLAALAAGVLALASPIAIALGDGSSSSRVAKGLATQVKTLRALEARASALSDEVSALTGRAVAIERARGAKEPGPGAAEPRGPAGGDLDGSFPSPQIRASSVFSSDIADGAITSAKLAPGSIPGPLLGLHGVGSREIAPGSLRSVDLAAGIIGAGRLSAVKVVTGPVNFTSPNSEGEAAASCPVGTRMIAGGTAWGLNNIVLLETPGLTTSYSAPAGIDSWKARGRNNSTGPLNFFVRLLCLDP